MSDSVDPFYRITAQDTLYPLAVRRLKRVETFLQVVGVAGTIVQHGLRNLTNLVQWELGIAVFLSMLALCVMLAYRYHWSLAKPSFFARHRAAVLISLTWAVGTLGLMIFGQQFTDGEGQPIDRPSAILLWSEMCLVLRAIVTAIQLTRRSTARRGTNPAFLLVGSFLILITVGTTLLMLPKAYADPATLLETPFLTRLRVALFTATSASCVTGLFLVDTGTHWSPMGHMAIMGLIQFGGLGIMTCGAFFAVLAGRAMRLRESVTLHEMLEAEGIDQARRLVVGIVGLTFITELCGAVLLSGLWADLPIRQRIFYSVFHAVSAFCNAGFTLTPNNLVGLGTRWQVWAVVPALIILGGLGFAVLYNVGMVFLSYFWSLRKRPLFNLSPVRTHLSISTRIILVTTAFLLVIGIVGYFVLEAPTLAPSPGSSDADGVPAKSLGERISDAWFQSVTFRTAGFNTVDHATLRPATKLLAVFLMFIGAAPGSTGGGVKVMVLALAVFRLSSILQGRPRVEIGNRVIADEVVNRALTILALGMLVTMTTTMLLVIFENDQDKFLDHLFEATSAFATVGVSSVTTSTLQPPSQLVLVVTMFLGRVGPLTILIGLAGQTKTPNYEYPLERVTLG